MKAAKIGNLVDPVTTWNPSRSPDVEFEYIDLSAVDNRSKAVVGPTTVTGAEAPSRARQLVSAGDVLVSTVRPNLNAVAVVPAQLDGATASTGFTVLRPSEELDGRFLFHWVQSPAFIGDMVRKATGASYPAVSDRIIKDSAIPAPPLPEQRRIATILDHADGLRTKRRQVLTHLDSLTQSIFHHLFGDLRAGSWAKVPFADVVSRIDNGTSPNCETRPASEDEWGVLKLGAVTYGYFQARENKAYLGDLGRMTANEVKPGDVLMTRKNTRELVGAVALVDQVRPRLMLPDLIFRLHLDTDRVDRRYFHALMMNPHKRPAVRDLSSGSASSMPNISKARLAQLPLELPPLSLQQQFAAQVESVDALRGKVLDVSTTDDVLFASLQSRAFRGDL